MSFFCCCKADQTPSMYLSHLLVLLVDSNKEKWMSNTDNVFNIILFSTKSLCALIQIAVYYPVCTTFTAIFFQMVILSMHLLPRMNVMLDIIRLSRPIARSAWKAKNAKWTILTHSRTRTHILEIRSQSFDRLTSPFKVTIIHTIILYCQYPGRWCGWTMGKK